MDPTDRAIKGFYCIYIWFGFVQKGCNSRWMELPAFAYTHKIMVWSDHLLNDGIFISF